MIEKVAVHLKITPDILNAIAGAATPLPISKLKDLASSFGKLSPLPLDKFLSKPIVGSAYVPSPRAFYPRSVTIHHHHYYPAPLQPFPGLTYINSLLNNFLNKIQTELNNALQRLTEQAPGGSSGIPSGGSFEDKIWAAIMKYAERQMKEIEEKLNALESAGKGGKKSGGLLGGLGKLLGGIVKPAAGFLGGIVGGPVGAVLSNAVGGLLGGEGGGGGGGGAKSETTAQLEFQRAMQKWKNLIELLSNTMKAFADAQATVIRNIRA